MKPFSLHHLPNALSLARLMVSPFLLVALMLGALDLSLIIFALAALTDAIDGILARRLNAQSKFGAEIDPLADKALTNATFVGLWFGAYLPSWALVPILVIAVRDIAITWLRRSASLQNQPMKTSRSAKVKTALQLLSAFVLLTSLHFSGTVAGVAYFAGLFGLFAAAGLAAWSGVSYYQGWRTNLS